MNSLCPPETCGIHTGELLETFAVKIEAVEAEGRPHVALGLLEVSEPGTGRCSLRVAHGNVGFYQDIQRAESSENEV